ncbi:MFS transporter [Paraburkholderia bannensis]|uniref:MFS transporter n=1 Tax=Paraburkholderia bannensis TaxID=765414 RepID=UPI002ABDF24F|nr:MFS transporter [Paraburkholderia bannensis]
MTDIDQEFMLRYRWFILSIGVLAQVTFATAFAGIPVAGVIMREHYHFSIGELGFVLGCMGLGVALSEIIWGILTDRLGDKIVLLIGLVAMGATFVVIAAGFVPSGGQTPGYLGLGLLLVLAGAVGGSINSSSGRAVMSWFRDGERGFAMSIRQTAIPVGGAIGSVLVPWVAMTYGFRFAFLTLSVLCLFTAACVWRFIIEIKNPAPASVRAEGESPLKRASVWKIALSGAALTVPQMAVLTFAGVFLSDHQHLSLAAISTTLVAIQLGGAALRILTGRTTDKYRNRREVIRYIAGIAGIASIALGLLTDQDSAIVLALLIVTGLAGHAWHGIAYTEIAVMSGVSRAGTALGMMGTTVFATAFLTPYAIPYILHLGSWHTVWLAVGVLSLLAVPLVTRSAPVLVRAQG